jgi:hypothetical protein
MITIFMKHSILIFIVGVAISCNSDFTPKPRAYYNIELPKHTYKTFDEKSFPYSFEYNFQKNSNFGFRRRGLYTCPFGADPQGGFIFGGGGFIFWGGGVIFGGFTIMPPIKTTPLVRLSPDLP